MKILVIASFADSLVNFREPLLIAFQSKGMQVHVVAPNLYENKKVVERLSELGFVTHSIEMSRTGTNPIADMFTFWELWRLMRHVQPTYVLSYTIKPVIYGSLAAWFAGVPHRFALITGVGYAFQESIGVSYGLGRLIRYLYRHALRCTHRIFFQNIDDQVLFRSLNLISKDKPSTVVNGSGVDVSAFPMVSLPSEVHFLLIARLLKSKGVREYALAAQRVRKLFPETRFSLVGWIDENPDAISQKELDQWIEAGTLNFLGRMLDVKPALTACSVFVLPSYREGTPRAVLEAMSMGRAIITTDAPGCRETVCDGDNGFLIPVKSVDALVNAMICFIEDKELSPRMGIRSRKLVEEKYDVHKVNDVILKEMGL